jgi:hypothetical protein
MYVLLSRLPAIALRLPEAFVKVLLFFMSGKSGVQAAL